MIMHEIAIRIRDTKRAHCVIVKYDKTGTEFRKLPIV